MDHKTVEQYVLSMPDSKLDYPFGEGVAVYKVLIEDEKYDDHQGESQDKPQTTQVSREQGDAEQSNGGSGDINASGAQGADEYRSESYKSYGERDAESATQQSAASSERGAGLASSQAATLDGSWKMYALIQEGKEPVRLSLKCDPELSKVLRDRYESVQEGYHLNKKHWITIVLSGQLSWPEVQDLIRHSYQLVSGQDVLDGAA